MIRPIQTLWITFFFLNPKDNEFIFDSSSDAGTDFAVGGSLFDLDSQENNPDFIVDQNLGIGSSDDLDSILIADEKNPNNCDDNQSLRRIRARADDFCVKVNRPPAPRE